MIVQTPEARFQAPALMATGPLSSPPEESDNARAQGPNNSVYMYHNEMKSYCCPIDIFASMLGSGILKNH